MNRLIIGFCLVFCISACISKQTKNQKQQISQKQFEANVESLQQYETPDWFRDAKFGIWNVWGPYSVPAVNEWYGRTMYIMENEHEWQVEGPHHRKEWGHQSEFGYKDFIPMWKAEKFAPDALLAQYKKAGAKYYTSIATFHDNYDLFDSKHTRWDAVETGPHKDIVKMFQDATQKAGLRYGATTHLTRSLTWWQVNKGTPEEPYDGVDPDYYDLYHKPYDQDNPADTVILQEWAEMWNKRLNDLIDNYELDLLYFDGHIPFGEKGYDVVANFYNNNLKRHEGKENGVMCIKHWPKSNGKEFAEVALMDYERKKSGELKEYPWQTDDHVGSWGYDKDAKYRSTNYVVDKLIDIVSKNGNLLLCLPLKPDGTHPEAIDTFLIEMGEWMQINGEALYGSRPWLIYGEGPKRQEASSHSDMESEELMDENDIRFTVKGEDLFVFQLGWPENNMLVVNALGKETEYNNKTIKSIILFGTGEKLDFVQSKEKLTVTLPTKKHCENAYVVKVIM